MLNCQREAPTFDRSPQSQSLEPSHPCLGYDPWPRIDPALINSCPPHWGLADQLATLIDQVPSSEYKPQCPGTHWYTQYLVPKVETFIFFTIIPVTGRTSQNQSTRSLLVAYVQLAERMVVFIVLIMLSTIF